MAISKKQIKEYLIACLYNSLFIDIADIFGLEKAIEFFYLFEGTTIKVPSFKDINKELLKFYIFEQVFLKNKTILHVANELDKPYSSIRNIYNDAKKQFLSVII